MAISPVTYLICACITLYDIPVTYGCNLLAILVIDIEINTKTSVGFSPFNREKWFTMIADAALVLQGGLSCSGRFSSQRAGRGGLIRMAKPAVIKR